MTATRVIDCLLLEGETALLRAGLAMFKVCQNDILQAKTSGDVLALFRTMYQLPFAQSQAFVESMYSFDVNAQVEKAKIASLMEEIVQQQKSLANRREMMTLQRQTHFTGQELQFLKTEFDALHDKKTQGIGFTDFAKVLLSVRPNWKQDQQLIKMMWDAFDVNHDKQISFGELMAGLSIVARGEPEERLGLLFDSFDRDDSGSIDASEFDLLMNSIFTLGYSGVESKSATLFKQMDTDGNGTLDRTEFLGLVRLERDVMRVFEGIEEEEEQQPEEQAQQTQVEEQAPEQPNKAKVTQQQKQAVKEPRKQKPDSVASTTVAKSTTTASVTSTSTTSTSQTNYQGAYQAEDEHIMAIGEVVRHDSANEPLLQKKKEQGSASSGGCCECLIL
eukprot:TRINITY_DN2474_c0_g2_i2.p1 TRINITY_DN2474_c0_g2~~TRINITY_DN2474_c0_g2_i2.p1  ORF type:complete len:390 (+),score=144.91 TRINITY_DN2474_c0_g2_i2:365-1534(+)